MAIWACAVAAVLPISSAREAELKRDLIVIVVLLLLFIEPIELRPAPASMRERVEFPVGLDLPPAMREAVRLEHQEADDDQADRDLAQEGDVVVELQRLVDGAAFEPRAQPLH